MEAREDEDIPTGMPEPEEEAGNEATPLGVPADADDEGSDLPGIPDDGEPPSAG